MITWIDLYIFNIILSILFISKKDKLNFFLRFTLSMLLPYVYLFLFVIPKWISRLFKVSVLDENDFLENVSEYTNTSTAKLEHEMIVPYLDIVYFGSVKDKREYLKNVSVNHDNIMQVVKIVLAFVNDTDSEVKLYASSALTGITEILPQKLKEMTEVELTEDVLIQHFNILVTLYENEIYDKETYDTIVNLLTVVMNRMIETSIFDYHIEVIQFCMKYMPSKVEGYMMSDNLNEEQHDYLELDYAFYMGDKTKSKEIIQKYKNKITNNERLNEILGMFGG